MSVGPDRSPSRDGGDECLKEWFGPLRGPTHCREHLVRVGEGALPIAGAGGAVGDAREAEDLDRLLGAIPASHVVGGHGLWHERHPGHVAPVALHGQDLGRGLDLRAGEEVQHSSQPQVDPRLVGLLGRDLAEADIVQVGHVQEVRPE